MAGITVLPVRSTRVAPGGSGTSPLRPTRANPVVLHEERGALDDAAVADDQALAVEQDAAPARRLLSRGHARGRRQQ